VRTVIEVDDVWKKYRLGVLGTGTLRHDLDRWWHRIRGKPDPYSKSDQRKEVERSNGLRDGDLGDDEIWALRGVSFEVREGEILGIIGRNGAGKSTLLKILSRVTSPTKGEVGVKGRIASLLEVGTGFHPELTGRENVFLNGAILGMTKTEIRKKFDEIVTFAGIETYIDTPVKRYSSGMYVRLAFAVAAHLEPEILIVDEVLAIGDAEFQEKCLGKMSEVAHEGRRTVLFVSHQMNAVQSLCSRCLLFVNGGLHAVGKPASVIGDYLRKSACVCEWINTDGHYANPYFKPMRFALVDRNLQPFQRDVRADEDVGILLEGHVTTLDAALVIGFAVYTVAGALLFWSLQTDTAREHWPEVRLDMNRIVCWLPQHMLNEGEYRMELIVSLHWRAWFCQPGVNAPAIYFKLRGGLSQSPHWMEMRPGPLAPILLFEAVAA
jgi:homopolymeric O-antigen transport system ATP-binding protein